MTMALGVKISFSWTNYCRLCLLDDGYMVPIFEEEGRHHDLVHKIETCFQLVAYDGDPLPRNICHKCLCKINQTYDFQMMVTNSYEQLKSHLLPLKHVPEVQQYLQRAEQLQRSVEGLNGMSPTLWSTSSPISSRCDLSQTSKPKIYIKSEKELMEGPSSSTWTSTPSASIFSHPDSIAQDRISLPLLSMQSQSVEIDPSDMHNIHSNSLNRKRKLLGSDDVNLAILSDVSSGFTKLPKKKQLAGPASRKRLHQNAEWRCVFCNVTFSTKGNLTSHIEICLRCSTCKKEFCSVREKAIHEAKEHMAVFINCDLKHLRKCCTHCPARFASSVMLSVHLRNDHPPKSRTGKLPLISLEKNKINCSARTSQKDSALEMLMPDDEMYCDRAFDTDDYIPLSNLKNLSKTESQKASQVKIECQKCFGVFTNLHRLESHICYHDRVHSNYCTVCKIAFLKISDLQEHNKITHCNSLELGKPVKNYVAKPASKKKIVSQSNSLFKNPETSGLKKKLLSCHTCYAEFEEEEPFILHLYKHATEESEEESKPKKKSRKIQSASKKPSSVSSVEDMKVEPLSIKCERCFVVCRKEYYKVHLATHMSKAKTSYPCSGCCQDFRNVEALNRHTCGGTLSKGKQTCCLDCGQNLLEGEDHICDNKCPVCDRVFRSARGQRLHYLHKHRTTAALEGHDGDHQVTEMDTDPDDLDEEQKSESMDPAEVGDENCPTLSEASAISLDRKVNEELSHESESVDNQRPLPVDSEKTVPLVIQEQIFAAKDSSDGEASDEHFSKTPSPSFIDESLPRERLPPDGAPPDDPVPCGAFGSFSIVPIEKTSHSMGTNLNVNAVS